MNRSWVNYEVSVCYFMYCEYRLLLYVLFMYCEYRLLLCVLFMYCEYRLLLCVLFCLCIVSTGCYYVFCFIYVNKSVCVLSSLFCCADCIVRLPH
jgi:hypothetical protein